MSKFFILMLFAFSLIGFNQTMASSNLDHNVIFNDGTKTDETKGEETNPEDDCE